MIIYLYIKTKNYHSLKKFSRILIISFLKQKIKKVKYYPLSRKRTLYSILKSPHVNKTAQEQFEFKYSHRKIVIFSKSFLKTLIIIKRYYSSIFYDIKIKILFSLSQKLLIKRKKKTKQNLDLIGESILKFK